MTISNGQIICIDIPVQNCGTLDTTNTIVTITIPDCVIYSSSTPSVGVFDPITGVWTVGDLPIDAKETLNICFEVVDDVAVPCDIGSVVSSDQTESNTTNNVSTYTIEGIPCSELANCFSDTGDVSIVTDNEDGTVTHSAGGVNVILDICKIVSDNCDVKLVSNSDGTITHTSISGTETIIELCCPTLLDITGDIADPFDLDDPALDCTLYDIGTTLTIGTNTLCPDFIYEVLSDGMGGCRLIMTQKPDGASTGFGG